MTNYEGKNNAVTQRSFAPMDNMLDGNQECTECSKRLDDWSM